MSRKPAVGTSASLLEEDVDAVMAAARVLVGVIVRSVDAVEGTVTMAQLRVLMLVATRDPMNLAAVAEAMEVHPSNASRACDRLVEAGLLERRDSTTDRRNLVLNLSHTGRAVVDAVIDARRDALRDILKGMATDDRHGLAPGLVAFADAAGEFPGHADLSAIWSS